AAAVLRPRRRRRGQLRRHRRGDRARDRPRLRRPGQQVRRRRRHDRLVGGRRPGRVRPPRQGAHRPVLGAVPRGPARPQGQRRADRRREHRRPRRPHDRAQGVQDRARRRGGARDRRAHRLPAGLLRVGPDLAHHHPRGRGRPQAHHRSAQPARSALQRRRHQPRHVPRGVRRAPGRRALHGSRAPRADLVMTRVAVLGTGIMGAGMARSLARAGLSVSAWNRHAEKAQALAADGISVAEKPEDAVAGAAVVVTMLFDAASVAEVMGRALPVLPEGAVWAQTSTVGLDGTAELAELARAHEVGFVDAPVLGTRQPAEQGQLTVLAAGPTDLREAVAPVFDAIGAKTVWVGDEPGAAHRLKLVANAWVFSVITGTAQSIALAEKLGLDPQLFLETIAGGALDAPYVQLKGRAMIAGDYPPAFAVDGALKDSGLIADALRATGADDRLITAVNALFADAAEAGRAGEDMAAVAEVFRR